MPPQPTRIAVIYEAGKRPKPVWFELNRRQHKVTETTYFWRDRTGDTPLMHYAVSDGEALYELVFNPKDESWTIQNHRIE